MENKAIEFVLLFIKSIPAIIGAITSIWKLSQGYFSFNNLFKKGHWDNMPEQTDIRTKEVIKDLEVIRNLEQQGLPYMEKMKRDKIFCLYELLNGKFTYKQITEMQRFIETDDSNRYFIKIDSMDKKFYWFANGVFILFLITMALIIIIVQYIDIKKEGIFLILNLGLFIYLLLWIANIYNPIANAIKAQRIIENKDFIYTEKK